MTALRRCGSPIVAAKVARTTIVASIRGLHRLEAMLKEWAWSPETTETLLLGIARVRAALAWQRAAFAALALDSDDQAPRRPIGADPRPPDPLQLLAPVFAAAP